ncbi:hypothetical protein MIR68_012253 [Amoeboaphelidium protococcarum]|nr:hypothetical protein MIR68_012253 [Amoeboaphelidium protococcarum]
MSDIENRLQILENAVKEQGLVIQQQGYTIDQQRLSDLQLQNEIRDLKAKVSDLQVQLAKIKIRDLLAAFGQMFCRRVGALYKYPVLIQRQKDQIQEEFVNFSKTSNMKLLLEKLDEKTGCLPQIALAELENLCGSDPVELARHCHEHQGDPSD